MFIAAGLPVPCWDAPACKPSVVFGVVDVVVVGIPPAWELCCRVSPPKDPKASPSGAPALKLKEGFEFPPLRVFVVARYPVLCWATPAVNPSI